jgi:hypothetical protein
MLWENPLNNIVLSFIASPASIKRQLGAPSSLSSLWNIKNDQVFLTEKTPKAKQKLC